MDAVSTVQSRINAEQALDALVYGIRSIEISRSPYGASPAHVLQIDAAVRVAEWRLGRERIGRDNGTVRLLKVAKQKVAADLAEIKARAKAIGGVRQLRMALAVTA